MAITLFILHVYRVVAVLGPSLSGPLAMEGAPGTAAVATVTPTPSTLSLSAVQQNTEKCLGTRKNVPPR